MPENVEVALHLSKGRGCQSFFEVRAGQPQDCLEGIVGRNMNIDHNSGWDLRRKWSTCCWKLEKRWSYGTEKARTNEGVWKCLGGPKDALEFTSLSLPLGHQFWWWGDLKEQLAPFIRALTMPLAQESEKLDKVIRQSEETVGLAAAWC